ncbi:hypothetical protein Q5Y75_18460 [Ruegeria sp. 2205SS24-7]|uniref:hypothetical protein n=1 Tax=Ruegeria discodermiae TaxID=3064389 RepID=UPI002741B209|nr:hypothetical protein [Ruegeria sp. 2205SS24-7]MDP5219207.1 hypothetical protein [Ruegeria sp. 2205SS24-7]
MNFNDIELRLRYPYLFEDKHQSHRDCSDARHHESEATATSQKSSPWIIAVRYRFELWQKERLGNVSFQWKNCMKTRM